MRIITELFIFSYRVKLLSFIWGSWIFSFLWWCCQKLSSTGRKCLVWCRDVKHFCYFFGCFFIKFIYSLLGRVKQEQGATFVVLMKPRWTQSSRSHRKLTSKSFLSLCLKEKTVRECWGYFFVGISCRIFTIMDLWLMKMWNKEERFIDQVDAVLLIHQCVWVCVTE